MSLQAPIAGAVDSFFLRWLIRCLRNSQQIEFRIVSFVKEQSSANFLNDDIPAVVGTNTAHQSCQDRVSCINIAFSFSQFTDDWIISGGNFVEDPINSLQSALILNSDSVVLLVVVF